MGPKIGQKAAGSEVLLRVLRFTRGEYGRARCSLGRTSGGGLTPRLRSGGFFVQVARYRLPTCLADHPEPTLPVNAATGELGRHVCVEVTVLLVSSLYRTVAQAFLEFPPASRRCWSSTTPTRGRSEPRAHTRGQFLET